MRLVLISRNFPPKPGGVAVMAHELARAFALGGDEVRVLTGPEGCAPCEEVGYSVWRAGNEQMEGAVGPARKSPGRSTVAKGIEDLEPDAILLVDQAYSGEFSGGVLRARRRLGVPVGLCCHGYDVGAKLRPSAAERRRDGLGIVTGALWGKRTARQRVSRLARAADQLFSNSRYTADLVRRWSGREASVVGCGLAEDAFERETQAVPQHDPDLKARWRGGLGLSERPMVSYVGRLAWRKNLGAFLEALAAQPELQGAVVGEGEAKPALERKARELGLEQRLTWFGHQPEETKWKILRASDVFCLPSRENAEGAVEGFGIVLLEAAAAGTPSVAGADGGVPDVIEDAVTGKLWDDDDPGTLGAGIAEMVADRGLARRCVDGLREQIRTTHNWRSVAQRIRERLVSGPGH
jgi:glycosyltransferase involved in cell wall biosynthesis